MRVISNINVLTREIIGAAIEVHRQLGPGLLESSYTPCFESELAASGLYYDSQRIVPIIYKGRTLDTSYRIDLIVENTVLIELKAVERILTVHEAQLLTYLRLTDLPLGLVINFNVAKLTDGVKRLLNPRRQTYPGSEIDAGRGAEAAEEAEEADQPQSSGGAETSRETNAQEPGSMETELEQTSARLRFSAPLR